MINRTNPINRKEIKWEVPSEGFEKVNFDEAAKGNPRVLRFGFIVRSYKGGFIKGGFARILDGTKNIAEAEAPLLGLRMKNSLNLKKIEGDSMNIVLACRNSEVSNWRIQYIMQDVKTIISKFEQYSIAHCYREANVVANYLANQGCNLSHGGSVIS
ncbi:hypothetical protein SUGI_0217630 [Cryptomeria japonica]|nr:hypothetical protein SUGI_0217630 [Cryptomeria japonica]